MENTKIWVTSDWHFCHEREFLFGPRGFKSADEANEEVIRRHNEVVGENDIVYFLGDAMLNDNEKGIECIKRLKGRIVMLRGNHDTDARMKLYKECPNVVEAEAWSKMIKYKGHQFYLSHFPTITANLDDAGKSLKQIIINLYGHTHQQGNFYQDRPYMYHAGMDSHDCYPVCIDTILEDIRNEYAKCLAQL